MDNRDRQKRDSEIIIVWTIMVGIAVTLFFLFIDLLNNLIK
jgi:hypothetical protein